MTVNLTDGSFIKISPPCMGIANQMAPDLSAGILGAEHESGFKNVSSSQNGNPGFLGSLIMDLGSAIQI